MSIEFDIEQDDDGIVCEFEDDTGRVDYVLIPRGTSPHEFVAALIDALRDAGLWDTEPLRHATLGDLPR